MFSLPPSLSFSLSDDAAAAAIGHPSCVAKTELKATLHRAPLRTSGRQDSGLIESFHFSPKSLFLFFSNYLRQFYLPLSFAGSLSLRTLFSGDEDFALAKEERRRNLGFVVYTR